MNQKYGVGMSKKLVGISAVLLLIISSQVSFGSMIQNGSFETGDFSGWISSGNIKVTAFGGGSAVPSDGLYGVNFNGGDRVPNGELSQSFTANVGTTYLLEFDFAKGGVGVGTASLDVTVEGSGVLLNEIISDNIGGSPGAYSSYGFSFIADSTSLVLSFSDRSNGGAIAFDGALDNISVQSIPEPSSIASLGLASGCILFFRRRFRS